MSLALPSPSTDVPAARPAARAARPWLVHPAFDLVLVANLLWPLVALAYALGSSGVARSLDVFQLYFLSTPHRWITLVLVFGDARLMRERPGAYLGLGAALLAAGTGLILVGGYLELARDGLVLLMMVDYAWNSWHFAAQHAGVARIYGRQTRPEQGPRHAEREKAALRVLVLWVFFRLAVHIAATAPGSPAAFAAGWLPVLAWLDPLAVLPALLLVGREALTARRAHLGRVLYLGSVTALYGAQLVAIATSNDRLMAPLFLAGAAFHATEYLAVVAWSVRRKSGGLWAFVVPRLALCMAVFALALGVGGWAIDSQYAYHWAAATLLVSLLHYAYDGMIWRAPKRPAA